jgi:hypothetical protein
MGRNGDQIKMSCRHFMVDNRCRYCIHITIFLNKNIYMRFQVPTVASMKFRVFWDVLPCSQIDVDQCFRGACCLHHQGDDSSPWWWRQHAPLKCRSTSIWLHSSTSQKTLNFKNIHTEHQISGAVFYQFICLGHVNHFALLWWRYASYICSPTLNCQSAASHGCVTVPMK